MKRQTKIYRNGGLALLGICTALALPGWLVAAETSEKSLVDARPGASPAEIPPAREGKLTLSLADATRLAISRNLNLEVTKIDADESHFRILDARGVFDPTLAGSFSISSDQSPSPSSIQSSSSKGRAWDVSVGQALLPGTKWSVGWNNNRNEANSIVSSFNPSFYSGLTLSVTQPLLRNFGTRVNGTGILVATNGRDVSRQELRRVVQKTIVDTENAYWDAISAREELKVQNQSLDVAQDLLRITKIRVDVGTLAQIEIVGNESGVATREELIIRARANIENAEDRLKKLVNVTDQRWSDSIELTEVAQAGDKPEVAESDLAAAFSYALDHRPEMLQARLELDSKQVRSVYDSNQTLPSLDLAGTYGFAGLSGDRRCTSFDTGCVPGEVLNGGGYGDALSQITDRDFRNWSVALRFSLSIFNRSARARATISRLEVERGKATMASLEQEVRLDVRLAARGVLTAHKTIYAAEKARTLGERNLDAERKKYENGITTNFQILQIEQQLAEARLAEIRSRVDYQRALTNFHRAKGDLLEIRGVGIVDDEPSACGPWVCCAPACRHDATTSAAKN